MKVLNLYAGLGGNRKLKNLNHDPSKRSSPVYFIAQLEKLTQPLGPKRKKENHTASMRNHVIEKEERKYLRRPGY